MDAFCQIFTLSIWPVKQETHGFCTYLLNTDLTTGRSRPGRYTRIALSTIVFAAVFTCPTFCLVQFCQRHGRSNGLVGHIHLRIHFSRQSRRDCCCFWRPLSFRSHCRARGLLDTNMMIEISNDVRVEYLKLWTIYYCCFDRPEVLIAYWVANE